MLEKLIENLLCYISPITKSIVTQINCNTNNRQTTMTLSEPLINKSYDYDNISIVWAKEKFTQK